MFINSLLLEYELTHCNAVKMPLDRDHPLGLPTDAHTPIVTRSFQRLVSWLLFFQICSCPDISFAVLHLSQHCSSPKPRHFAAAKRVLRYLKGTRSYRLHYGGEGRHLPLSGLSDADWAGDKKDRASVSGFANVVSRRRSHQLVGEETKLFLFVDHRNRVRCPHMNYSRGTLASPISCPVQIDCPLPLVIDNNGAKSLSVNDSNHGKVKHIDIRYHFICSHIEANSFIVTHTPGVENTADLFTKPLSRITFQSHVARLGLSVR